MNYEKKLAVFDNRPEKQSKTIADRALRDIAGDDPSEIGPSVLYAPKGSQ